MLSKTSENGENVKGARPRRPKISSFIEELAPKGAPTPAPKGGARVTGVGFGFGVLFVIPDERAGAAAKRTAGNAHPDAPSDYSGSTLLVTSLRSGRGHCPSSVPLRPS